jgi:hypothetical protein
MPQKIENKSIATFGKFFAFHLAVASVEQLDPALNNDKS